MPPLSDDCGTDHLLAVSNKFLNDVIEKNRCRRVTFDDKVSIERIESVPNDYRGFYWMSKQDFDRIKRNAALDVLMAKTNPDADFRGLERSLMSEEEFLKHFLDKKAAIRAVLTEQSFQRQVGYISQDDIADAYVEFSSNSSIIARKLAENDETACRYD
jgi:hypothetical protein